MAASDDGELLARLELELGRRYGSDYEIVCEASAEAAIVRLSDEGAASRSSSRISGSRGKGGAELLSRVGELRPEAQRGLEISGSSNAVPLLAVVSPKIAYMAEQRKAGWTVGSATAVGVGVGAALSVAIGGAAWIAVGAAVGAAIGAAAQRRVP